MSKFSLHKSLPQLQILTYPPSRLLKTQPSLEEFRSSKQLLLHFLIAPKDPMDTKVSEMEHPGFDPRHSITFPSNVSSHKLFFFFLKHWRAFVGWNVAMMTTAKMKLRDHFMMEWLTKLIQCCKKWLWCFPPEGLAISRQRRRFAGSLYRHWELGQAPIQDKANLLVIKWTSKQTIYKNFPCFCQNFIIRIFSRKLRHLFCFH